MVEIVEVDYSHCGNFASGAGCSAAADDVVDLVQALQEQEGMEGAEVDDEG